MAVAVVMAMMMVMMMTVAMLVRLMRRHAVDSRSSALMLDHFRVGEQRAPDSWQG
jgi:hypothetical protein